MTPEQQRIAIAEFCGRAGALPYITDINIALPDYLNDLNAMAEVFNHLENTQQARFGEELSYILKIHDWTNCKLIIRAVMNATAAQRAEALLRTIGKWTE